VRRWLEDATVERDQMLAKHAALEVHLNEKNRWAMELDVTSRATQARVIELQQQVTAEQVKAAEAIARLEATLRAEQARAADAIAVLEAELKSEQARAIETITLLESTVAERTEWAQRLDQQVQRLSAELKSLNAQVVDLTNLLRLVRESRWVKAGRVVGLGPDLKG
jgi:hypothetical protein